MKSNTTEIITELCNSHIWIAERYVKITSLFGECTDDEQVQLTAKLLSNFLYVDETVRNGLYQEMSGYIVRNYDALTVISAMTVDSAPDSGSCVVNDLKTVLYFNGISSIRHVSRLSDILRGGRKRKYPGCTKVIMVDEFCGSGQTIANRINLLKSTRSDVTEIHVCMMAGMNYALNNLTKEFPDVHFFFARTLKRGILEYYNGEKLTSHYSAMIRMEKQLAYNIKSKNLGNYSFGYGNAQALIAFSGTRNIPNSVFPWFWWPLKADSSKRNHLFIRYEDGF